MSYMEIDNKERIYRGGIDDSYLSNYIPNSNYIDDSYLSNTQYIDNNYPILSYPKLSIYTIYYIAYGKLSVTSLYYIFFLSSTNALHLSTLKNDKTMMEE